jgi:hypothetical protein
LEQSLARGGSEVERHVPSCIDDGGFWRSGAVECQMLHAVLRAQGGGTIWCHGGVDGNPSKKLHFGLTPRR